jgi:hypothetical protein
MSDSPRLVSPEMLPELPGAEPVDFVLEDDGYVHLILKAGGRELWREAFGNSGSGRPREIEDVVRRRYGARVRSFESRVDYGD